MDAFAGLQKYAMARANEITSGRDVDWIPGYSWAGGKKPGARNPKEGQIFGRTVNKSSEDDGKVELPNFQLAQTIPGGGAGSGYGGGGGISAADQAAIGATRGDAAKLVENILDAYQAMFGDLDQLIKDQAKNVEEDYGEQFEATAKQYADSLPMIEGSYAAIGAADSTDTSDAKDGAKEGFDTTNKQIGKNKEADLSKIGQYGEEMKAKWGADKDRIKRIGGRLDETDDLGDLREARNSLEDKWGDVKSSRGTLNTEAGARGKLSEITKDAGRFESVTNALDSILKGSMSGAVKDAAVKSVIEAGGLSDEEKQKVQTMYGNTYAEQATA